MIKLKEMVKSKESMASGLQNNGQSHTSYKLYTSMSRALAILNTGYLYLANGQSWNDGDDRKKMKAGGAYAICLSWSTRENIAMWMLYSGDRGENGAMLNFPRGVLLSLLKTESIDLGCFEKSRFVAKKKCSKDEFEIRLVDVVYEDVCKNKEKVKLTWGDEHITASSEVLDHNLVFSKDFSWEYERECRIVVTLNDKWKKIATDEKLTTVRLTIPQKELRKMTEDRLICSPVYSGDTSCGMRNRLDGTVEWKLK